MLNLFVYLTIKEHNVRPAGKYFISKETERELIAENRKETAHKPGVFSSHCRTKIGMIE